MYTQRPPANKFCSGNIKLLQKLPLRPEAGAGWSFKPQGGLSARARGAPGRGTLWVGHPGQASPAGVGEARAEDLKGGERGPKRDIVLVNVAAALVVAGWARDSSEGMALAAASIDSGAARAMLDQLVRFTGAA